MEEIMGCRVEGVVQYENERSFALRLTEGYLLLFKMHGNRSNLVLFKGEEVVELFHHRLAGDEALRPGTLHRPLDQSYEAFLRHDRQVSRLYPTLGKVVNEYLQGLGFAQMPPETQWETLQRVVAQLENPVFYITPARRTARPHAAAPRRRAGADRRPHPGGQPVLCPLRPHLVPGPRKTGRGPGPAQAEGADGELPGQDLRKAQPTREPKPATGRSPTSSWPTSTRSRPFRSRWNWKTFTTAAP
jgi:hypothetical protein